MNALFAVAIGYVIGAKTGGEDLGQLTQSLKVLCGTDEFADVIEAARAHVGGTLRAMATMIDGDQGSCEGSGDLVAQVRHLVGNQ